ncbi:MAG: hypothetical protein KC431_25745 [Myxococcales bacterium]|nr:hypothetical protein [Myxococcales bacterium]
MSELTGCAVFLGLIALAAFWLWLAYRESMHTATLEAQRRSRRQAHADEDDEQQ